MAPVVLVVEEQAALREAYTRALQGAGYRVVATRPVAEARRVVRDARPDLILLDPDSGGGEGKAIAQAALSADPRVAVIYNTSRPSRLETDFSSWVADAYTVRSIGAGELGQVVAQVLRDRRARGGLAAGPIRRRAPARV